MSFVLYCVEGSQLFRGELVQALPESGCVMLVEEGGWTGDVLWVEEVSSVGNRLIYALDEHEVEGEEIEIATRLLTGILSKSEMEDLMAGEKIGELIQLYPQYAGEITLLHWFNEL